MKVFYHLLANTTISSIVNFTVWFGITFYTYLQTRSVFATAIISGIYLTATALSGIWFGSLVDHHKKKTIMMVSSIISLATYIVGLIIYLAAPEGAFAIVNSVYLWTFIPVLMAGIIAGNLRMIVQPTLVTLLIDEKVRDKANGLAGMAGGISFLITSVISGILVGHSGMLWILILAIIFTTATILHLFPIKIPEKGIAHGEEHPKVDLKGTIKVIRSIPGLLPLILFATFNNFIGGVFMALMDPYGLSLVSVQVWGLLWGLVSTGFIIGGLVIAKFGLGKNPLKSLFIANIIIWSVSCVFTIYPSIFPLVIGMFIYICVVPYIEASEQTIIQKVVPTDRQGRVFGFSQSVEQAASPLTAFLIGPITQFIFIPFMTTGSGVDLIGNWFGTGEARGMALVFTVTGVIGLVVTIASMMSKYYKELSGYYLKN